MVLSFAALFACIYQGLETAAVGVTDMIPAIYTAYVGVGHMDFRKVLSSHLPEPPYADGL
jgi:hypothetical protein